MAKVTKARGQVREFGSQGAGRTLNETLIPTSNAQQPGEAARAFVSAGALEPPYNPSMLIRIYEQSSSLQPNIDALAQNIDGYGFRLEPIIDFDKPDAMQKIADDLYEERLRAAEAVNRDANGNPADVTVEEPTQEEVNAERDRIVKAARRERRRVEQFFESCTHASPTESFTSFRKKLRKDYEIQGNAYFEVLRNARNQIEEFVYVPAHTMRLLALDVEGPQVVTVTERLGSYSTRLRRRSQHFRRYVQLTEFGKLVYFKSFGDRRVMSRESGRYLDMRDPEAFKREEAALEASTQDAPATEIMHLRVHSPHSAYGVPRWIGTSVAILGQREAEEVNQAYFSNKSVPPLAVLVSGGRLSASSVKRLTTYMDREIKGTQNFHKVLVVEAEASSSGALDGGANGRTSITMQPLTDAQQKDGLFLNYDARVTDKVGGAFRIPRIIRGDTADFNRATAEAALDFCEQQVFQPERTEFDVLINRIMFSDMGFRYWRFLSNAPSLTDPLTLGELVASLVEKGVLTPAEARDVVSGLLKVELAEIRETWATQPLALTIAGLVSGASTMQPYTGDDIPLGAQRAAYDADPDAADTDAARASLTITPTMFGGIVSVNEARTSQHLGVLMLPDGTPDPDGDLSIAEFMARRGGGNTGGGTPNPAGAPAGTVKASVDVGAVLRGDLTNAIRLDKMSDVALQHASYLKDLRGALIKRGKKEADAAFIASRYADGVPPELVAKLFPRAFVESLC